MPTDAFLPHALLNSRRNLIKSYASALMSNEYFHEFSVENNQSHNSSLKFQVFAEFLFCRE